MHPVIFYQNWKKIATLCRSFNLKPHELVLDVGSGQNPNPRANVLCDRFVLDNTERNQDNVVADRPLIIGDAESLPFHDQAFDFVICSHLLEHMEYPEKVIAELQRVGKRGYIETPSAIWEKLHSFAFHRWYVSLESGKIIFREKAKIIHDPELKSWVDDVLGKSKLAHDFQQEFSNLGLLTRLYWDNSISFQVERNETNKTNPFVTSSKEKEQDADTTLEPESISLGTKLLRKWAKGLRRTSDKRLNKLGDLIALCVCPHCRQNLTQENNSLSCNSCARTFELRQVQGRLVPDLSRQIDDQKQHKKK